MPTADVVSGHLPRGAPTVQLELQAWKAARAPTVTGTRRGLAPAHPRPNSPRVDSRRTLLPVNHAGIYVLVVRGEAPALGIANQVVLHTQIDGLAHVLRANGDRRVVDRTHEACRGFSEEGNRCDVVGNLGRHRCRHVQRRYPIGHRVRGDEARHRRPLGESAKHDLGVRTVRRGGKDMCARVPYPIDGGGEVDGSRVVDRVDLDRLPVDSRP